MLRALRRLRAAMALGSFLFLSYLAPASAVDLDQRWSASEQEAWYGASQGSRLMPLAWFKALEQPGSTVLFLDNGHIASYRYLPRATPGDDRLPVGFAVDRTTDSELSVTKLRWKANQTSTEPWVGMNCSACHTAQLTYKQQVIRVDGGPTLADFQSFFETLNRSLVETRDDSAKFERFAKRVLGTDFDSANRAMLKKALREHVDFQEDIRKMNAAPIRYGYARLDAIGFIFNKVSRIANGSASSANPSTAPVSYPFIWNVPQHDRVQWNGIAENHAVAGIGDQPFDIGALGRNVGEVIGVFADVRLTANAGLTGFVSSVDVPNLVALEQQLGRLRPPRWPAAVFGPIDTTLKNKGRDLFKGRCSECHARLDRTELKAPIKAVMTRLNDREHPEKSIGTDPWMACNAYTYDADSGVLKGYKNKYFTGEELQGVAHLADMLTVSIAGVLLEKKFDVVKSAAASFFGLHRPPKVVSFIDGLSETFVGKPSPADRLKTCMTDDSDLLAYKGRPLTGIWATAPFLHNGSVPTLHDLLLPPEQRPASFYVGTREFDPVRVGYEITASSDNGFLFETREQAGKPIDGNSNLGHDYGNATLSPADRDALVEYMKSL